MLTSYKNPGKNKQKRDIRNQKR